MSQAVLISDNQITSSLFEVNLKAYVAMNVTVKKDIKSAVELLDQSPNIDAVICFKDIVQDEEAFVEFSDYLISHYPHVPLIIMGETDIELEKSIIIKNQYNIKTLLQSVAKILEITAKDMAALPVPEYFPIPVGLIQSMSHSHCEIYNRNTKENFEYDYQKIIEAEKTITTELDIVIEAGIEYLYINSNERLKLINRASMSIVSELEKTDISTEERVEVTEQVMGAVAEEVFDNPEITAEIAEVTKACIESIKQVVADVPRASNLIQMLLENKTEFVFKHSVLTSYIAGQLIDNISWGTQEQKDKISFALYFHDIYLVPIYKKYTKAKNEEDLLFRDDVDEGDKQTVLDHAKLASQLVKTFPRCPMGADSMIAQHHGMTTGQGFAVQFKDDISPLAKVMIVSEEIATYLLERVEKDPNFKINKKAFAQAMLEKFRTAAYRKIIQAFVDSKI